MQIVSGSIFFPSYLVTHLPAFSSDHNPLLLNFSLPTPSLPRPFRFEDFWTRDPTCGIVIEEAWSTPVAGSPSFCLSQKLKFTKTAIKQWNKQYFRDITTKLNSTLAFFDLVQQAPSSDEYPKQEESLWKSKSRELWLTTSGFNTRFFSCKYHYSQAMEFYFSSAIFKWELVPGQV